MSNSLFRKKNISSIIAEGSDGTHGGQGLKRVLTVKDLTFFGIAAILGAGSLSSLGGAVFNGGPGVVVLFIITAIACGFTALCYSEFASRIPVAGSAYTYAYASWRIVCVDHWLGAHHGIRDWEYHGGHQLE